MTLVKIRKVAGQDMAQEMGSPLQLVLGRVCELRIFRKVVPDGRKNISNFLTYSCRLTRGPHGTEREQIVRHFADRADHYIVGDNA